jgi:Flp pilus assembly protein TadD
MFYNNIGAQAIVNNEYIKAYAYLKMATTLVPDYIAAWGNLALIYKHNDLYDLAEQTYRYALKIDRDNLNVLDNLSLLLAQTNRKNEANEIAAKIASERQDNPYYFALLADEAFQQQNWREAVKHYKKAVKMSPNEHEFYFGLAKTYYQLGDIEQSKQYLVKAMKHNDFFDVEKRYSAKLTFLQSL